MNIGNMVSGKARQRNMNLVSDYVPKPIESKGVEKTPIEPYCKKNIENHVIEDYVARSAWMDKIGLQLTDKEVVEENEEDMVKVEIRRTL